VVLVSRLVHTTTLEANLTCLFTLWILRSSHYKLKIPTDLTSLIVPLDLILLLEIAGRLFQLLKLPICREKYLMRAGLFSLYWLF
jgi:hypothetical protein